MPTSHNSGSATIHQFPAKGEPYAGSTRGKRGLGDRQLPGVQYVEFGSGWYHEAAVQDSVQRAGKSRISD